MRARRAIGIDQRRNADRQRRRLSTESIKCRREATKDGSTPDNATADNMNYQAKSLHRYGALVRSDAARAVPAGDRTSDSHYHIIYLDS
jgi:hypothetical protein